MQLTTTPNGGNESTETTVTTNAEVLAHIFDQLEDDERPMVVRIAGPISAKSSWPAMPWSAGQACDDPDANWYFTFSTYKPDAQGNYRRTKAAFFRSFGVTLDDIGTKSAPRERLNSCPPSYLIETSAGNYQAGYLFRKPCTDAAAVEALVSTLADAGLSDPGAKGAAARLGRLPFASNRKREPAFQCRLVEWHPHRKYTLEEIAEKLGLVTASSKRAPVPRSKDPAVAQEVDPDVYRPRSAENAVLTALRKRGLYKKPLGDKKHDITCPWVQQHTNATDTGTVYFEPNDLYPAGGFKCLHGHCADRRIGALLEDLGVDTTLARNRPTIRVLTGDLHRVVDVAERELAAAGRHYQRGGLIVSVHTDPGTGEASIKPTSPNALLRALSACAAWEKYDGRSDQMVACDPPARHVNVLSDADTYNHLPILRGLARQPYMRADGSLVTSAGYDTASGVFAIFDEREFDLKTHPSREDAERALQELRQLLKNFEFASPGDEAAALAAMLTAAVRSSLPVAPMFHVRATQIGSGKSYLCNLIAAFAGPSRPSAIAYPVSEEECAKLLLASLLEAPPMLMFDNLTTDLLPFKSICSALTEEYISGRVLGVSKMARVPTQTLMLSSGNNVDAVQDMARRTVTIALEPQCESPAARAFTSDPVEEVRRQRGRYVCHALTIVRAYLATPEPLGAPLKPLASYGSRSRLVRAPLTWLGLPDVGASIFERMADDPDRQLLGRLLAGWRAAFGTTPTPVRELISLAQPLRQDRSLELAEVTREIAEERGLINSRRLGRWISRHEGQIVLGSRLVRASRSGGSERWRLVVSGEMGVSSPASETIEQPSQASLREPF